jgi:hypothetical protein
MKNKLIPLLIFIIPLILIIYLNRGDINLSAEKNLKLLAVDTSGYMIQSVIVLNNPNLLSATVKTIRERFSIDNVLVGVIDNELNQGIPGRKESEFPVNIRFPKNILEAVADTHTTADGTGELTTEGEVIYSTMTGQGTVKIKSSVTVIVK